MNRKHESPSPTFPRFAGGAIGLLLLVACTTTAVAQSSVDRIRRRTGVDSGRITNVSVLAVTISKGGVQSKVPVEEILSIYFAGEPSELKSARSAIGRGRLKDAVETLSKINRDQFDRREIVQELDYLLLEGRAKLALAGQGELDEAIRLATDFLAKNRNSYHVSSAIELLGDLHLADGKQNEARRQYAKLAKALTPYFQARSAILTGKLLQQAGKHAEALAEFDRALAAAQGSPAAQSQQFEATLHRAISQSASGDPQQATAAVKQIIAQADAQDTNLLATAYNALGDCYLQSGKQKAARDAFLHVDVLFNSAADQHAKALYELSRLWDTLGQRQRARDAKHRLQNEYPASRWAKR
ncbi:MAG: tetratricopeptide repeat protein [Planctomycetes bacterium]|nr:tetratricopeptide repeat protein [Planctomycetota bacterium]